MDPPERIAVLVAPLGCSMQIRFGLDHVGLINSFTPLYSALLVHAAKATGLSFGLDRVGLH